MASADSKYTLRTLRKGLALLAVLGESGDDLSLTELAGRLDESPTVVFRILKTLALAILRETDSLYLDLVDGSEPLRVYAEPGQRVPIYATASGKAMLAHA